MSKETEKIIPAPGSVLYIDIGNTSVKGAFQSGGQWQQTKRYRLQRVDELLGWMHYHAGKFSLVVISSVVETVTKEIVENLQGISYRVLRVDEVSDSLLDYATPETLGIDRFLACYGGVAATGKATVVIDAGTACTIDFMTDGYVYRGGVIMPGISAVERALKTHAPALPEVPRSHPTEWPGRSTTTSLQWGTTGLLADGIYAVLTRYRKHFGDFELVMTGGDAEWLASVLKWEGRVRPLLVFEGMKQFQEDYLKDHTD